MALNSYYILCKHCHEALQIASAVYTHINHLALVERLKHLLEQRIIMM